MYRMHHSNATNDDHGLVSTASSTASPTTAPNLSLLQRQLRPASSSSSSSSIPLHHLPLRPGTATLLYACGYRYTHDVVQEDIPTLARELRPFRGTGSTKQNESRSCTSSSSSSSSCNHLEYARRIYQEVVDAVAIVLGTTTTTTTTNAATNNGNNSSSVPMTPMAMTTTVRSSTVQTAADLLRRPNGVVVNVGGGPPLSTTTSIQPHRHHQNNNNNNNNNSITSIITFCRALDDLLGGGIAVGELTELAGPPGSGKTTLTMQLAVNAALPEYCGGVHGRTVLIDTEGSFSPERCHDLATHLIQHVQTGLKRKHRQSVLHNNNSHHHPNITTPPPPQEWNVTASQILDNILVYRAHDVADLTAIVGALPALLEEETTKDVLPIRLVLIDSLAFPYRAVAAPTDAWGPTTTTTTIMDYATRTQHLTTLAATLTSYAVQYQCAVVAVNQMTTKFVLPNNNTNTNNNNHDEAVMRWRPDSENDPHHSNVVTPGEKGRRTQLIPALGESWAHAVTSRLILLQRHNSSLSLSNDDENNDTTNPPAALQYRTCALTKSPRLPAGEASLVITPVGIRGMEYIEAQNKKKKKRRTSTSNPSME